MVRVPMLAAAVGIAAPLGLAAQDLSAFRGVWTIADPAAARQGGGFPAAVEIDASAVVTIRKHGYGPETYRMDGAPTQLIDGRTGTAAFEDGALAVTYRRQRPGRATEPTTTLVREVYRRTGNTLTLARLARSERPKQEPSPWVAIQTVTYHLAAPP